MAAKIRNLAVYAQQLAETGIQAEERTGGHFQSGDGHMAAKIRKLVMYAQQLAETGIKAEGRSGRRFYSLDGRPYGGQDQVAGYVCPAAS